MNAFQVAMGIVLLLLLVGTAVIILMQEGKGGMGALTGSEQNESFGRNAGKTLSATLKTLTKFATVGLFVIIILINIAVAYF